jgi:hypothetical protein
MKMTRVTIDLRIDAPKEKVWDVVADLGSVSVWNTALAGSHYTSEAKEDSKPPVTAISQMEDMLRSVLWSGILGSLSS